MGESDEIMMKTILKIFAGLCVASMLIACGAAGKGRDASKIRDHMSQTEQKDTTAKCDTFVPLHPPVVVNKSWREAK